MWRREGLARWLAQRRLAKDVGSSALDGKSLGVDYSAFEGDPLGVELASAWRRGRLGLYIIRKKTKSKIKLHENRRGARKDNLAAPLLRSGARGVSMQCDPSRLKPSALEASFPFS